jgi:hypothetical protein
MRTITVRAKVDENGRLHLDVPAGLPPGPVEVVVVIQPEQPEPLHSVRELRGLGKEIWQGLDAQEYVNQLRDEWDRQED